MTRAVAGGPPGGAIEAIVFDPKDPAVIYGATDWSGVFKTTDRGENWTAINTGLTKTAVYALAIDPLSAATLLRRNSERRLQDRERGRELGKFQLRPSHENRGHYHHHVSD